MSLWYLDRSEKEKCKEIITKYGRPRPCSNFAKYNGYCHVHKKT